MKGKWLLPVLALAGLLAACETVEEEIPLGLQGPARHNPLLAAERFCTAMGLPGSSHPGLSRLPAPEEVLLLTSDILIDRNLPPDDLTRWLKQGGHLVLLLADRPLMRRIRNLPDSEEEPDEAPVEADRLPDLLNSLGIRRADGSETASSILQADDPVEPGIAHALSTDASQPRLDVRNMRGRSADYIAGPAEAASIVSVPYGQGRLTVFADVSWITNPHIGEHRHADLLWSVLQLEEWNQSIRLIYANHHSFLSLLTSRFWPFLLALAAAVLAWLWKSVRRAGPVQEPPLRSLREFSRHLQAAGSFLWRLRMRRDLVRPAQERIVHRAQRLVADPRDRDKAVVQLLAARSRLDPDTVRSALRAEPRDAAELVQLTLLLQRLDQCL